MTDNSTASKKELSSNEKTSNNTSVNLNNLNQENNALQSNLLNANETYQNKSSQNFTFKIIKRRAPWNKKEDEAIIELVNKYGTTNWTIIANEMALIYKSKQRNGKQCRERWHNHLDPIVNKDNWTEEEENILFNKHLEYGNKWSDISKFLPGRTDNSIKNHFYSKLRKFIRKILKQINKENLLKNNGIDFYKYNSDKVYKLLKKYKISYKNVTKETILDIILATEKNQKGKIFGVNDENKIPNNFSVNNNSNTLENLSFNLDNDTTKNNNNNNGNKFQNKNIEKKSKAKSKQKNNYDINGANEVPLKKDKKIFKSNVVNEVKTIKNENGENLNKNKIVISNQTNNENNKNISKSTKKNKNLDKKLSNNQKDGDGNNNNSSGKKKLTINPEYVDETYKFKLKSKTKIKGNADANNKKLLNKKRRRKKRRKVTISLSTPENKKTRIDRIMPGRRYIFGLGQKISIRRRNNNTNKNNKLEINPEDFDPLINDVEIVRDGLEIHSKSIILINKSLLTEKLFKEQNYNYKPNLNISIPPLSPKVPQFQSIRTMKNGEENNYINNFSDRNILVGLPTPMDGYYEPQLSPMAYNMFYQPPSTKNIYNVNLNYENNFFRKNFPNSYIPQGFNASMTPKTPNKEINLDNKILIHNNSSNINNNNEIEINNAYNTDENSKKPAPLNMELIDNYNNENNGSPTYPLFPGSANLGKQMINSPVNIFNLSPTSPFIPRNLGEKPL